MRPGLGGAAARLTRLLPRHVGPFVVIALLVTIMSLGGLSQAAPGATPEASPAASPMASPVASPMATLRERPGPNIIVGHITIHITDTGFIPTHFESAVGRNVTINLVNDGSRPHNFTMQAFDITVDLAPGEEASVYIPLPNLGEFVYTSDAPGDEDFSGKMVVFI